MVNRKYLSKPVHVVCCYCVKKTYLKNNCVLYKGAGSNSCSVLGCGCFSKKTSYSEPLCPSSRLSIQWLIAKV